MAYAAFPATWTGGTDSSEDWSIYVSYSNMPVATPEYSWGPIVAILLCFGAFAVFIRHKKA
jgi:hypothetical protein